MASGRITGSVGGTIGAKSSFYIAWSYSQNQTNGTTTISATAYLIRTDGYQGAYNHDIAAADKKLTIYGTAYTSSSKGVDYYNNKIDGLYGTVIASGTKTISTRSAISVTLSASFPYVTSNCTGGSASGTINIPANPAPYSSCTNPTTVSITNAGSKIAPGNTITVSWSGAKAGTNNAVASYNVYINGSYVANTTSTSYSFTASKVGGTTYYAQIKSIPSVSGYGPSSATSATGTVKVHGVKFNGVDKGPIYFRGTKINHIYLNGTKLF